MWMPAISAIIFLRAEKVPLKEGINWGIGSKKTYLLAILVPFLSAGLTVLIGLISRKLSFNSSHSVNIVSVTLTLIIWIFSSLGEEIGWRGYLHNHLRKYKHAPLYIGIIWGLWHMQGLIQSHAEIQSIAVFIILTILVSYFLSWLINSGGNMLACGLFHGVWNFLRLKILFGNPEHANDGYFISSSPSLTEMEGLYGTISFTLLAIPFIYLWYKKGPSKPESPSEKSAQ
jgi:membrane protease YdiL (CAAX protease family)